MNLKQCLQENKRLRDTKVNLEFDLEQNAKQTKRLTESFNLEEELTTYLQENSYNLQENSYNLQENSYKLIRDTKKEKVYSNGTKIFGRISSNKSNKEYLLAKIGESTTHEFIKNYMRSQKLIKYEKILKGTAGIPLAGFSLTGMFAAIIYPFSYVYKNPTDSNFTLCATLISQAGFVVAGITGGLASMMKMEIYGNKLKTKANKLLQKFTISYGARALEKLVEICEEGKTNPD